MQWASQPQGVSTLRVCDLRVLWGDMGDGGHVATCRDTMWVGWEVESGGLELTESFSFSYTATPFLLPTGACTHSGVFA